jgi:hypothetical protein
MYVGGCRVRSLQDIDSRKRYIERGSLEMLREKQEEVS